MSVQKLRWETGQIHTWSILPVMLIRLLFRSNLRAAIAARDAVKTVEVEGFTPRMRVGVHTGRPQRIGSDWLGVDVNLAARVMERATKGELVVSASTLERIADEDFDSLGVTAKRLRRQVFTAKQDGVPPDFTMYRLKTRRQLAGGEDDD